MRKQEEAKVEIERRCFEDAIFSFKDGFALFDTDDHLVIFNDAFSEAMKDVDDILKPGVTYEEFLRAHSRRNAKIMSKTGTKIGYEIGWNDIAIQKGQLNVNFRMATFSNSMNLRHTTVARPWFGWKYRIETSGKFGSPIQRSA